MTEICETLLARYTVAFVEEKTPGDYVTSIDYALEEEISGLLLNLQQDVGVYSEEKGWIRGPEFSDWYWLFDPLDGTSNVMRGVPLFCSSVALMHKHQPVIGVVYDPLRSDVYDAVKGGGARLNSRKLTWSTLKSQPMQRLAAVSTGAVTQLIARDPDAVASLVSLRKLRITGSQALNLCYLASGVFDVCLSYESKIWDDAAGSLIAKESGCGYQNTFCGGMADRIASIGYSPFVDRNELMRLKLGLEIV